MQRLTLLALKLRAIHAILIPAATVVAHSSYKYITIANKFKRLERLHLIESGFSLKQLSFVDLIQSMSTMASACVNLISQ